MISLHGRLIFGGPRLIVLSLQSGDRPALDCLEAIWRVGFPERTRRWRPFGRSLALVNRLSSRFDPPRALYMLELPHVEVLDSLAHPWGLGLPIKAIN